MSAFRWPLAVWRKSRGVMAATQRIAVLGYKRSGHAGEHETTLGDLRRFVDSLEQWPNDADVSTMSGAMLEVRFTTSAPDLIKREDEQ